MPKPLREQVIVITGASSGIGRETAIEAGKRGASVVLAARGEKALNDTARAVEAAGGKAHVCVTDVGEWAQVNRLAEEAVDRFGRIDTWVNNASVSTYAAVEDTTVEEMERVIQVNLLGTIYGSKAAIPHMKRQGGSGGGTIINVASALAVRAVPLQVGYCAAKHGVKGFTEGLRLEMAREKNGIHVTLILPSSINTPFFDHARSKLGVKPQPVPPVYESGVVAETILFAAEHPRRDLFAGGAGKLFGVFESISAPLLDGYMLQSERLWKQQKSDQADSGQDNLFAPLNGPASSTGSFGQMSMPVSPYTRFLELHPARKRWVLAASVVGTIALLARGRR